MKYYKYRNSYISGLLFCIVILMIGCSEDISSAEKAEGNWMHGSDQQLDQELIKESPLENNVSSDIISAKVKVDIPGDEAELSSEEIDILLSILQKINSHNQNDAYYDEMRYGQSVIYTLEFSERQMIIVVNNPYILIDDVAYKPDYEICEELSELWNQIRE